jgi:hypothetical protein
MHTQFANKAGMCFANREIHFLEGFAPVVPPRYGGIQKARRAAKRVLSLMREAL